MGSEPSTTSYVCSVCGETAPAAMSAECNWCDQRYHLNQRNDMPGGKDCGSVWIDDQFMALQFACGNCLEGAVGLQGLTKTSKASKQVVDRVRRTRLRTYKRRT